VDQPIGTPAGCRSNLHDAFANARSKIDGGYSADETAERCTNTCQIPISRHKRPSDTISNRGQMHQPSC
jgi:hypothetical protein